MIWNETKIDEICKNTEYKFKNEEAKKEFERIVTVKSSNDYGKLVLNFANRWAKCMQYLVENEKFDVFQAANETIDACKIKGIDEFALGRSISVISKTWKYGDNLKAWSIERRNQNIQKEL